MFADHENEKTMPWEVNGDRAIANIRQTKTNLTAIFAVC